MELYIEGYGKAVSKYNNVRVGMKFDCIADTFSFLLYFDPSRGEVKDIFRPLRYRTCQIKHLGVLVMTGTILSHKFVDGTVRQMVQVSGYSKTGILNDSSVLMQQFQGLPIDVSSQTVIIPPVSLQADNLTLVEIAQRVCGFYGFTVVVDKELANDANFNAAFTAMPSGDDTYMIAKQQQTVFEYLDVLCKHKNVVLSHDQYGNVLITNWKSGKLLTTTKTVVQAGGTPAVETGLAGNGTFASGGEYNTQTVKDREILSSFDESNKGLRWLEMRLDIDGQRQHSVVQVVGQVDPKTPDPSLDSAWINPYGGNRSYARYVQEAGSNNDTPKTARAIVGDELKNITLDIDVVGWTLGGNLITPNQLITVENHALFLYKKTTWFIQEVMLSGDEKSETATLRCVLPDCFGIDVITGNIFE